MINNSVYCGDRLEGFRCFTCGDIVNSMWGTTCNRCRNKERKHKELLEAIKAKKEQQ